MRRRTVRWLTVSSIAVLWPVFGVESAITPAAGATAGTATVSGHVSPERGPLQAAVLPSDAELEAGKARYLARREALDAKVKTPAAAAEPNGLPARSATPTREQADTLPAGASGPVPNALSVRKNFRNTVASAKSSLLAEPAATNDSTEVFMSGNLAYRSRSANSGSSWTDEGNFPAGPSDAPIPFGDTDAVHHAGLDTTFHTILYVNSSSNPTNGVVRIFVRRGTISGGSDCTYLFDPSTTSSVLPDYPHIAVSNGFLFLTANLQSASGSWLGSVVRRFNASQLANCQTASFNTFTFNSASIGQRVFVPAENATTAMYWGQLDSATSFRIYRWLDSSTSVSQFVRPVSSSSFTNPDCRGGTGNFDFIERGTSFSITGFRMRGAVGASLLTFFWNVGPDSAHVQGHVHGASFRLSDLVLSSQPAIFNQGFCFGFPVVGSNSRNDLGLSIAAGGKKGGGGTAAHGDVGVDDSSTAGIGFGTLTITASATHNRSDSRFGDYFTVRNNDRCARTWSATNYGLLNGNTSSSNVNARYVEFQSTNDAACP